MASLVVPVTFHGPKGKLTVRTLIDTGAEMSLISDDVAGKIGVPVFGQISVRGAGKAHVRIGKVSGIEVPGARLCRTGPSVVWIFGKKKVYPGTGIEAFLGYDFMKKTRMEIAVFATRKALRCRG